MSGNFLEYPVNQKPVIPSTRSMHSDTIKEGHMVHLVIFIQVFGSETCRLLEMSLTDCTCTRRSCSDELQLPE